MSSFPFLCLSFTLSWCPHVSVSSSLTLLLREHLTDVLFKDEKHGGGESKSKHKNIHKRTGKTLLYTHRALKPWGLSPAWHWTLQGRQHLLTSIFNTTKREHCVLRKLLISLCMNTETNTLVWTHIILSKLHICAVQVAIESSQVPTRIHAVTKSHFAQDTLTDRRFFALQSTTFTSIFPPLRKVFSDALTLSPSRSLSAWRNSTRKLYLQWQ